jgi:uncharacterized protein
MHQQHMFAVGGEYEDGGLEDGSDHRVSMPNRYRRAVPTDSLRDRLRAALPTALKARDRAGLAALRSALAAIDNAEAVGAGPDRGLAIEESPAGAGATEAERRALTEAQVRSVVLAEVTERRAAAEEYERAGRTDRAELLRAEAAVLEAHLDDRA